MTHEEITPERRIALLGAALHAIAWQLVEYETDTSDRGVSEEHYRDALERATAMLPTLMPGVVAEEPEWEYGWHTGSTVSLIGRRDQVEEWLAVRGWKLGEGDWGSRAIQRRVAGPWVPVMQES